MPACGHEFYLLVFNSISYSFAALTRQISSWTLEDKIHIYVQACNILYISHRILTTEVTSLNILTIQLLVVCDTFDILFTQILDFFLTSGYSWDSMTQF